ncbi:hypothetical protein BY996DRAFT_8393348 [Phakopsora pachyrhizi]|nr:hypothetical protein BY996DRAFT_8393348 [Phakopsora pachyrhizi]
MHRNSKDALSRFSFSILFIREEDETASDDNSPHRKKNLSSSDGVDLPQIADRNKVSSNFSTLTEPHPSWNSKNQSYQGNQSEGVEIPQLAPIPVSNSELNPQRSTEAFPEVREKPIIKQQRAANMSTLYGSFPVANPNEQQKTVGETSVPAPASFPVGSYMNLNRTNAKSSLENSHSTNVTKSLAQSSETTEKLAQLNQENHKLSAGQIAGISISASILKGQYWRRKREYEKQQACFETRTKQKLAEFYRDRKQVNEHQPPPILPLNPPPRIDGKSLNVGPISKIHLPTRLSICFEAPKLSTPGPKAIETPALNQVDTAGLVEEVEEIEEAEILERQAVSFGYLAKKD